MHFDIQLSKQRRENLEKIDAYYIQYHLRDSDGKYKNYKVFVEVKADETF